MHASHNRRTVFSEIRETNAFMSNETSSGPGSERAGMQPLLPAIESLLTELKITSVLDAPCGDFNWVRDLQLPDIDYTGVDIVDEIVKVARSRTSESAFRTTQFHTLDIVEDSLPCVDLILCKDAFVHMPYADVLACLRNFRASGSSYLLTTTFADHAENTDIVMGGWRTLNLEVEPFCFPPPAHALLDHAGVDNIEFEDKRLALWSLASLDLSGTD